MREIRFLQRFSFKVIAGLISMLFLVGIPFFLLFLSFYQEQIHEAIETSTTNLSRILTRELELSVLEGRHHLLDPLAKRLPEGGGVLKVMIFDAKGRLKVSSDPSVVGRKIDRMIEPGCIECHSSPVLKTTIQLLDPAGEPFYRNVNVIQNRPGCQPCHGSTSSVNGILIMDFSQAELNGQFRSSLLRLIGMATTMLALTIAVLYILLNQLVLRKLKRFERAAEEIGGGSFSKVNLPGNDEFTRLAESFNVMSDRLDSAVREIRGSRDYLEGVINNISDEIIVVGHDHNLVIANAAYHRRLAATEAARGGRCPLALGEEDCSGNPVECERCAAVMTFRDGREHKVVQHFIDHDGKERFVESFSSPLKDEQGVMYQVIEVRRDITERKLLEANLAHSERLASMGLLASGLAHEINNPLASISTFVEGLKRRFQGRGADDSVQTHRLEDSLNLIQGEIDRAKEVSRRLLILAQKGDTGRSLVDLNHSLKETVSLVMYEAEKRGIRIQVETDSGVPVLKNSESQIRQVLLNLLLNSLQAVQAGGRIECRTGRSDGRVFVSIEDDGVGIEPSDHLKIFEPFFSKKNTGHGTGLGLFISKSIVSSFGGSIEVQSSAGKGAKFTVWLPLQP